MFFWRFRVAFGELIRKPVAMWQLWFGRIFPVRIETQGEVLRINDRRPSNSFLSSVVITAVSLIISALISQLLLSSGIYWPLVLFFLPAPIFAVKSLMSPLRATHIFDKNSDRYEFRQETPLKSQTSEGNVSQIRGVQVERRITGNSSDSTMQERIASFCFCSKNFYLAHLMSYRYARSHLDPTMRPKDRLQARFLAISIWMCLS
jgi:hypothetical protein